MVIGVLAVICHAESWYEIELFARTKETWLRQFLDLPNGIPSHDTFDRVFGIVDPHEFEICFMEWINEVRVKRGEDTICIDGKTHNGTKITRHGQVRDILTTVSAWSTVSGLVLGQIKANGGGSCEVEPAKDLIKMLDLKSVTVVADAGIGSGPVAREIREKKGNYLFPIKKNSRDFYLEIEKIFDLLDKKELLPSKMDTCVTERKGHGRNEKRTTISIPLKSLRKGLNLKKNGEEWYKDLKTIGRIIYERNEKENRPFINSTVTESTIRVGRRENEAPSQRRTKTEIRYFVTNLEGTAEFFSEKIRLQWSIENQLHWVLDVSLGEDGNRTRNKVAASNLATARRIAINLVKQDKSKSSIRFRLKRAGWDQEYLESILFKSKMS